jgi:hypothetical protein
MSEKGTKRKPSRRWVLVFTHILGWTQGTEVRNLALSLGERVASVASQVRGYLVMSAHPIAPRRASDPSPGPRRLVKAPVAVHPLPLGEGKDPIPSLSPRERGRSQTWDCCVQREMWDTLSLAGGDGRRGDCPGITRWAPQRGPVAATKTGFSVFSDPSKP